MALSIRGQAFSLLLACGFGLGLGLLYDMLRPIRRRGGDTLWDGLFCLCAAGAAFFLAMRAESGVLGTGELLMSLLGLLAYFHFLSPACVLLTNTQLLIKKVAFSAKKLFQNSQG